MNQLYPRQTAIEFLPLVGGAFVALFLVAALATIVRGQNVLPAADRPQTASPLVIENNVDTDVFGIGKSVVVKGTAAKGVMSFGGDVIVEGRVEGDVAAVGGSVFQRENSFIGGDVIVLGGAYHHGKTAPLRSPASSTVMYAGYEEELRSLVQNPSQLVAPEFSAAYLAGRILAALFWFVVSLTVVSLAPGAVGRAIARLQLASVRVALIGSFAVLVATLGVAGGLGFLPTPISVVIGLMTMVLLLLAYVFGRIVVQAATGRWLQRGFGGAGKRSESVALLLGSVFWTLLLSIPFVMPFAFLGLLIVSLGIVLTARPRLLSR